MELGRVVIGAKVNVEVLIAPLAVGTVGAVKGGAYPVVFPLIVETVDAVDGVGPVFTPLVVSWLGTVEVI